jgi:crossover junction endodeoxyribonuclease RuvC
MRVLAIDPGYDRCGVAVVERQKAGDILLYSACIITKPKTPFPDRLAVVGREVAKLIHVHKPSSFALEKLYFNTNQKTAMGVAEVRGALIYIARSANIPIFEYTPPQVKVAVSGSGRADKKQLAGIIPKLIRIEKNIQHDDEYDAIALGITHLASTHTL